MGQTPWYNADTITQASTRVGSSLICPSESYLLYRKGSGSSAENGYFIWRHSQ